LMSVAFLAARHCAFHCYNNHLSCLCSQLTNKLIGLDWIIDTGFPKCDRYKHAHAQSANIV